MMQHSEIRGPLRGNLVEVDSRSIPTWEGTQGIVEMSQMPNRGIALVQWLWANDTVAEGFLVRSGRTNSLRAFELAMEKKDDEGDTQYWVFESNYEIDAATRMGRLTRSMTIKIFND